MKSSSSVGPRSPAFSEFWLSATGTPWLVVSTRPVESTRTRSSGPTVGFWPMCGPPLPTLSEPLTSLTVLAPTIGSAGLTDAPLGGASAASGSYSAALFGLKANADATSWVPAAFSAAISPDPDVSGSAGPLTVARLLRTVLLLLTDFAGRDDFAMCGHCGRDEKGLLRGEVSPRGFVEAVELSAARAPA